MDKEDPSERVTDVSELSTALAHLGLTQYEDRLRENGFENWDTVTAITETDMVELDFQPGDRRKLQDAICEYHLSSPWRVNSDANSLSLFSDGLCTVDDDPEAIPQPSQQVQRKTRAYRRHPRPDPNAPRKPKTAYVLFGEHVRQDPSLRHISFTEIAKETGRRWRNLSRQEKVETWETPAAHRLLIYKKEFDVYKQTKNHSNYQKYLDGFKQKRHNQALKANPGNKASLVAHHDSSGAVFTQQGHEERDINSRQKSKAEGLDFGDSPQKMASPAESGMREVRRILKSLEISPSLVSESRFPPERVITDAVKAFISGTGSLLYLWDHDEALKLVEYVYHPQDETDEMNMTEILAMSAVGSFCDAEFESAVFREKFSDWFIYMLSISSDVPELRLMRLFACLAIWILTNSVESARTLIFSALCIGRRVLVASPPEVNLSEDELRYWWEVFRSVVFLESWFAYNTSYDSHATRQDLISYRPLESQPKHNSGTFQEHVNELGRIAAHVSHDPDEAPESAAIQALAHFKSLNEWHRTLPPMMQLSRLHHHDSVKMDWSTKRSILQLHMLFLGMFIEPYRSCLIELGKFRLNNTANDAKNLENLNNVEEQCVLAARQSARVVSLMQMDNLIRSHCWVIVHTSFAGCAILLCSASQKLLNLLGEEASQDLLYAASYLNALSLCSYDNITARNLSMPLQIIFNGIKEVVVSPVFREMHKLHIVIRDTALVPTTHFSVLEGAEETSITVLDLVRNSISILEESITS